MRQFICFALRRMELALEPEVRFIGPFLVLIVPLASVPTDHRALAGEHFFGGSF